MATSSDSFLKKLSVLRRRLSDAGLDETRLSDCIEEIDIYEARLANRKSIVEKALECEDLEKACEEFADSIASDYGQHGWEVHMERPKKPVNMDAYASMVLFSGRELRAMGIGQNLMFSSFYDEVGCGIAADYKAMFLREMKEWIEGNRRK